MYSQPMKPRCSVCTVPRRAHDGFTLIELVVVIAIVGLLSSLAAPALRGLLVSQRVKTVAYELIADLTLARSEALKRGSRGDAECLIRIDPIDGDWRKGWTVSVDNPQAPALLTACSPRPIVVLSTKAAIGAGVSIDQAPTDIIKFDLNGRLASPSGVVRFGISDGGSYRRCISLDPSGRPRTASTPCPT